MNLSKSATLIGIIAAFLGSVLLFVGCSDSPENKASRQLRQKVREALETAKTEGEFEKSRKSIKAAMAKGPKKGPAADAARLAAGNLAFEQSEQMKQQLSEKTAPIRSTLDEISSKVQRSSGLQIEQERLEGLLSRTNSQVKELEKVLNEGDGQRPGLREQLAEAVRELEQLEEQKSGFEAEQRQAQGQSENIQRQAEDNFRRAEQASGDEKQRLERAGYELLLGNKTTAGQEAGDQINSIEKQIAIVGPLVQKIRDGVESIEERVAAIKRSPYTSQLRTQLGKVKGQISGYNRDIRSSTEGLKRVQQAYAESIEEIVSVLEQSVDEYKKVRSSGGRSVGGLRVADSYFWMGSVCGESMKFQKYVSSRLQSVAAAAESKTAAVLSGAAMRYGKVGSDYSKKAMDNFDLALEAYGEMKERSSGDFGCSVIKSYILAMYGKMRLAEYTGEDDIAGQLRDKAAELMKEAAECDSKFSRSATARLFSGDDPNYVPQLAVNLSAYYAEMKKQFQPWKQLRGEEKEKEVYRLLAMLEEMGAPDDREEFELSIGPEKRLLEEAVEKGFAEEEVVVEEVADANFF